MWLCGDFPGVGENSHNAKHHSAATVLAVVKASPQSEFVNESSSLHPSPLPHSGSEVAGVISVSLTRLPAAVRNLRDAVLQHPSSFTPHRTRGTAQESLSHGSFLLPTRFCVEIV